MTAFTVTNTSNATLDFALAATQLAGGTAAHGGTDNFDVAASRSTSTPTATAAYDGGTDTQVTYLDQLAADASKTRVRGRQRAARPATGDVAGVRLTGTASEATAAGSLGATVTADQRRQHRRAVDTVFAEPTRERQHRL